MLMYCGMSELDSRTLMEKLEKSESSLESG